MRYTGRPGLDALISQGKRLALEGKTQWKAPQAWRLWAVLAHIAAGEQDEAAALLARSGHQLIEMMAALRAVHAYEAWYSRQSGLRAREWVVAIQTVLAALDRWAAGLPVAWQFRTGKSGRSSSEEWVNVSIYGVSVGSGNSMNPGYCRVPGF